jgi:hypothetical protein
MNREPQTLPAAFQFARNQFRPFNRTAVCAISEARNRLDSLRDARAAYSETAAQRDELKKIERHDSPAMAEAERRTTRAASLVSLWRDVTNAPAVSYGAGTWQGNAGGFNAMNGGKRGGLFHAHDDDAQGVFREVWDSADCVRMNHTGWYDNPHGESFRDGSGLCLGMAARLAGGGPARYVAGYRFGGNEDNGTFDMGTVYTATGRDESDLESARDDAARAGDSMAEQAADTERDYQTAWQAGRQWADLGEQITTARRDALAILAERRDAQAVYSNPHGFPTLCNAIRGKVTEYRDAIRTARDERAELAQGDDSALYFWAGSQELQNAFCEGADLAAMPT